MLFCPICEFGLKSTFIGIPLCELLRSLETWRTSRYEYGKIISKISTTFCYTYHDDLNSGPIMVQQITTLLYACFIRFFIEQVWRHCSGFSVTMVKAISLNVKCCWCCFLLMLFLLLLLFLGLNMTYILLLIHASYLINMIKASLMLFKQSFRHFMVHWSK